MSSTSTQEFTGLFTDTFNKLHSVRWFCLFYIIVFIGVLLVFALNISLCSIDIAFVGGGHGLAIATLIFNIIAFLIFITGSVFYFYSFVQSGTKVIPSS